MSLFRRRLWPMTVAGVLVALALTAAPARAQATQILSPGQEATLSSPGVALTPIPDGRVNSYGVSADVPGVAFTPQAGVADEAVSAATGAQLVVLHLTMSFPPGDLDPTVHVPDSVTVTLTSGTVSARLDPRADLANSVDQYFVAAIPTGGPAVLTVSSGGLSQSLDLRSGRRTGTVPSVLYRDASDPAVTVTSDASQTLTATTSDGRTASGKFGIDHATLTYWVPGTTTFASNPGQAYLGLYFDRTDMSVPADGTNVTPQPLPGSAVQVQLPDGRTLPTTYALDRDNITDLLNGVYYLPVPADVASAKVMVEPGSAAPADVSYPGGFGHAGAVTLSFPSRLAVQLNFPAAWTPPTFPSSTVTTPARSSIAAGRPGTRHSASGTAPTVWIALAAVVVLAGLAASAIWRRRRYTWLPPRPVSWPPRALSPATLRLLRPARLALPAGSTPVDAAPAGADQTAPTVRGAPAVTGSPPLVLRLLGPIEVEGLRRPIRRRSVQRLLVCLAVTPDRPLSADELAMAVSDHPDRDPKPQSIHSYASMLRQALPAGVLPDAGAGGYRLDHAAIVVDWTSLAAVADRSPEDPGWYDEARAALELVRDRPLAGGSWEGIEPAVRLMQAAIEGLARNLAARRLAEGDPAGAEWAAARGLAGVPGSVGLWQERLGAAAGGSSYGLERAWADAQSALGADAALLARHYQQLRSRLGQEPAPSA